MFRHATAKIDIQTNQKNIPLLAKLAKGYVEARDVGSYLDLLKELKEKFPETVGIITTNQDVKKIAKAIINNSGYRLFRTLLETISGHDHLFALINKQIKKYMNDVEEEYGASYLTAMISILPFNMVEDYFDTDKLKDILLDFAIDGLDGPRLAFARFLDNSEDGFKLVGYILGRGNAQNTLTSEIIQKITSKILERELYPEVFGKSGYLPLYTQWLEILSQAPEHLQRAVSRTTANIMESKIPEYEVGLTGKLRNILKKYPFALNDYDCSEMCQNILKAESEKSPNSGFPSSVRFVIFDFHHLPQFEDAVSSWVKSYAEMFMEQNTAFPHLPLSLNDECKDAVHEAVKNVLKKLHDNHDSQKIVTLLSGFPNHNSTAHAAWGRVNLHQIADDIGLDMATIKTATPEGRPVTLYVVFNKQVGTVNCVTLGSRNESVKLNFSVDDFRGAFAATTDLSGWAQELVQTKEPSFFTPPLVQQSPR